MHSVASASARDQQLIDREHIKLLSIFHFVSAGLAFCGVLFVLGHYALFHAFLSNPELLAGPPQSSPPAEFLAIFRWFYVVVGLWFLASAAANLFSALALRALRYRVFSMVVAGVNCMYVPLGTILGVFTFIVLARDSVIRLYEARTTPDSLT